VLLEVWEQQHQQHQQQQRQVAALFAQGVRKGMHRQCLRRDRTEVWQEVVWNLQQLRELWKEGAVSLARRLLLLLLLLLLVWAVGQQ
jgi:hypothetical protein